MFGVCLEGGFAALFFSPLFLHCRGITEVQELRIQTCMLNRHQKETVAVVEC